MMEPIDDLCRESAYFARAENSTVVTAAHVDRALGERVLRLNFIEEEIRRHRQRHYHRTSRRSERWTNQRARGAGYRRVPFWARHRG